VCVREHSVFACFFSSRRRHTRCYRDWSSDVCSSDLFQFEPGGRTELERTLSAAWAKLFAPLAVTVSDHFFHDLGGHSLLAACVRSEERRVGKSVDPDRRRRFQTETQNSTWPAREHMS